MFRIDRTLVNVSQSSIDLQAILAPPPEPEPEKPAEPEPSPENEEKAPGSPEPDTSLINIERERLQALESELEKRQAELELREAGLERETAQMLERAANEAREKLEAAEVLSVEIKSNAWREGYDEGRRAASEELERSLLENEERVKALLIEISSERESMFDGLERDAVELVLDIAKKVVDRAVLENQELYMSMTTRAVRELKSKRAVTLRVSPEVCESFFPNGSAEFTFGDKKVTASVMPDSELVGAALVAETEDEMIDAGTDTQLKLITLSFSETAQ